MKSTVAQVLIGIGIFVFIVMVIVGFCAMEEAIGTVGLIFCWTTGLINGALFVGFGMAVEHLARIEYLVRVLYHQQEKKEIRKQEEIKGSWKCPECGRINQIHTGTCACGKAK